MLGLFDGEHLGWKASPISGDHRETPRLQPTAKNKIKIINVKRQRGNLYKMDKTHMLI
jgi:hypothetical protein